MFKGLKRDTCLEITGMTKNQLYYISNGRKPGKKPTIYTKYRNPVTLEQTYIREDEMIVKIVLLKTNPDHANYYKLITKTLQISGYYINHKKVYRIMRTHLLLEDSVGTGSREYVQFRRVVPLRPLEVIEMDIKVVWIDGVRKYAFILCVIDTFTRYILGYKCGYSMKSIHVKELWEYIIATYYQPIGWTNRKIDVEVRTDNGKQFKSKIILDFFKENDINKVFTHPYTPEENAHIESFNKTLSKALKWDTFENLNALEIRLEHFFKCYVNDRSHGSTKGIPPAKFRALFEQDKIEVRVLPKHRVEFSVKVKYQDILLQENINKYDYRAI